MKENRQADCDRYPGVSYIGCFRTGNVKSTRGEANAKIVGRRRRRENPGEEKAHERIGRFDFLTGVKV